MSSRHNLTATVATTPGDDRRSPKTMSVDWITEAAAKLVAARVDQGLPPGIEDLAVLVRIAALLRAPHLERMGLPARAGSVDAA